jgi:O-antigen/teichoic acid export membrane protein
MSARLSAESLRLSLLGTHEQASAQAGLWLTAVRGIALRLGGSFLQFALFVLLARLMSAEEFGKLGSTYALAMTLAVVGGLGQGPLAARCWHLWLRERGGIPAVVRGLRVGYAATAVGSAMLVPIVVLIEHAGVPVFPSPVFIVPTMILVAAYAFAELQSFAMRADDRLLSGLAPKDIGWRSVVMAIAAVTTPALGPPSAVTVLWVMVCCLGAIVLLQATFWFRDLGRRATSETRSAPGPFDWHLWRALSLSVWLSSIGTAFVQHADVALVGSVLGPAEAAIYLAGARTSQILQLLPTALTAVLIPQAARAALEKGRDGLAEVIAVNNRIVFLPALALTLLVLAVPELALRLFGASFAEAANALRILAVGHLIAILCGPIVSICVGAGYHHAYTLAVGTGAAVLVAGILLLAPRLGLEGAALATAAATAAPPLALRLWLLRKFGINTGTLSIAHA